MRARELIDAHPETSFILVYGDMDRFKVFNDLYGIESGDRLLAAIGSMIANDMPKNAVAAHLRGDHFVECMPQAAFDPEEFLARFNAWFSSYEQTFTFFVRLGIYAIDDPDLDVVLMCDRALLALREAKGGSEKSQYVYYHDRLRNNLLKEQQMAGEMTAALADGQFVPFFQPQYRYPSCKLVGAEVLARWNHPTKGLIGPVDFIPVFERNGLITSLDFYIWEEACRILRSWLDERPQDEVPHLSVNLARADLFRPDLCSFLKGLIAKYRIPFNLLHLEITENAYMEAPEQLIVAVEELRSAGFTIDMDDFGSGYSSLNTLKDMPVDVLKLDLRFLDARNNTRGGIILASIVRMARWLELSVIAEGVETSSQADFLASIGCDLMQGFLFAKPLDRVSYEHLLDSHVVVDSEAAFRALREDSAEGIWDAESHFALLFSRFAGVAAIAEYVPGQGGLELVRGSDEFQKIFVSLPTTIRHLEKNLLQVLRAEDRQAVVEALDRIVHGSNKEKCEFYLPSNGGNPLWTRVQIRSLSRTSDVCSVFLQFEETTENQALQNRLRAIIDTVPGGIAFFGITEQGVRLLDFSDAAAELSDCTREQFRELVGSGAGALVCPEDSPIMEEGMAKLAQGSERFSCTVRVRRRTEGTCWLRIATSVVSRDSHMMCVATSFIDVTAEREAQMQLEEQAAVQDRLYDAIPCGIIRCAVEGGQRILSLNAMGCKILGCADFTEYLKRTGDDPFASLAPEGKESQLRIYEQLMAGEALSVPFTYRAERLDKTPLMLEGTSSLAEGADGRFIVQSAFNDVTDLTFERHKKDVQRYSEVLRPMYDEIFELNRVSKTSRLLYSAHRPAAVDHVLPMDEAFGAWMSHIPDKDDREHLQNALDESLNTTSQTPVSCIYRLDTEERPFWVQGTFLNVSEDSLLCCSKDISDRISDEDERASVRIADIIEKLPVGVSVYRLEADTIVSLYISDITYTIFGTTREKSEELLATGQPNALQIEIIRVLQNSDQKLLHSNDFEFEFASNRLDKASVALRVRGRVQRTKENETLIYAIVVDVTDEVEARRATSWLNERYRLLSEMTHAISFDYDSRNDTVLLYMDRDGTGMQPQVIPHYLETLSETRSSVVHPDSMDTIRGLFECARDGGESGVIEYQADYYGRGYAWYRTNLLVVDDGSGSWHLTGLIEDIQNEHDLRKRAEYDEITGLTNHAATKDLVNLALSDPLQRECCVCVALDIDDFKLVNDNYGHLEGDALLHEVGMLLHTSFRETDVVGRVGGDEFALLLKNISLDVALQKLNGVADRMYDIHVANLGMMPSLSMGVYTTGPEDVTYRDAFVKADEALYRAKRAGKHRIVVYHEEEPTAF